MSARQLSVIKSPSEGNYGTETDSYQGPTHRTSYQNEYRSSAQEATQFKTQDIAQQHGGPLSLSQQTRGGVYQWGSGGASSMPSFNQG